EGVEGPLVDGRPYTGPAFEELAEAYHVEAVAAHKQHAKVSAPLPVLVPVSAEGDGQGDGDVPSRPDLSGNGEVREPEPVAVAEGDGSPSMEADGAPEEAPPSKGRRKKKD